MPTTDTEWDIPIKNSNTRGKQGNLVDLPTPSPNLTSLPIALPRNMPARYNLEIQFRKFNPKVDKGKGRATDNLSTAAKLGITWAL